MKFHETPLYGAWIIEPEYITDERGFFARVFCRQEFTNLGLSPDFAQCSISFNQKAATLRGMHFQHAPFEEIKLVRCTAGAIYDVIIDLRAHSPSYKQWFSIELTQENRKMLYIPQGLAHGFQTLQDHTEVFYQISSPFVPKAASGVRWNDPAFAIAWPLPIQVISPKDQQYPLFA